MGRRSLAGNQLGGTWVGQVVGRGQMVVVGRLGNQVVGRLLVGRLATMAEVVGWRVVGSLAPGCLVVVGSCSNRSQLEHSRASPQR